MNLIYKIYEKKYFEIIYWSENVDRHQPKPSQNVFSLNDLSQFNIL